MAGVFVGRPLVRCGTTLQNFARHFPDERHDHQRCALERLDDGNRINRVRDVHLGATGGVFAAGWRLGVYVQSGGESSISAGFHVIVRE